MVGQVFAAASEGYVQVPLTNGDLETGDETGWSFDESIDQMQGQSWAEGPNALGMPADSDPTIDDEDEGYECGAWIEDVEDYEEGVFEGTSSLGLGVGADVTAYGTTHCASAAFAFEGQASDILKFNWTTWTYDYTDVIVIVRNKKTGVSQRILHALVPEGDNLIWHGIQGEINSAVCPSGLCKLEFIIFNGAYNPSNKSAGIWAETYLDNLTLWRKPATEKPVVKPADVHVVIDPSPNHGVVAGDVVTYTVTVFNNGQGGAKNATVYLPVDPAVATVLDATFDDDDAWVSELFEDGLSFETGPLASKDGTVVATIRLLVKADAPLWTLLTERALVEWDDWADDGAAWSNQPIVQVAQADDDRETYSLVVEPGVDGHILFSSSIFAPDEPVGVWYNTSDGEVVAGPTYYAEEDGSLAVDFNSTDLPAGTYSMVFYGHWTEFTVVGAFSK